MNYLNDIIYVNKVSIKKTITSLKNNLPIIFTGIVYTILNLIAFSILGRLFVGPLFIISGFIMAIISSSFISNYFYLLHNIINYNRFTIEDFKRGFTYFLWKIYGVFFIAYLGQMILSFFTGSIGLGAIPLSFIVAIAVYILFNPLPEIIYLKDRSPVDSIMYSLEFIQENWLNWLLPNTVLIIILYFITGNVLLGIFNTHMNFNMIFTIRNIVLYLISQVIFSFIMIYRGHLFKLLSTSTRRKRMFMNKF